VVNAFLYCDEGKDIFLSGAYLRDLIVLTVGADGVIRNYKDFKTPERNKNLPQIKSSLLLTQLISFRLPE